MRFEQQVQFASATDIGLRRKNNEDACKVRLCANEEDFQNRGHLFVVADGMGGHAVGELASRLAVETVPHTFYKGKEGDARRALGAAISEANDTIHARGSQNRDFQRMGTTCSTLVLCPKGAIIGHVGDSRVYRIRRDRIDQLTFDHSLQWELERQKKTLPPEYRMLDNRNVITRSLGPESEVEVDIEGPHTVLPGDIYLICSDGLSSQVQDAEIGSVARELSPAQACRLLVHLANLRGGADNCTVVIARVGDLPANVSPSMPAVDDPPESEFGWGWLAGFWLVCVVLAAGLSLLLFGRVAEGAVLTVMGVLGVTSLAIAAWRHRRQRRVVVSDDSATVYSRPHRTCTIKSSRELMDILGRLERDLRRAAQEEGWNVSWDEHQQAVEAAAGAMEQGRFGRAVRDYARTIDLLMSDLPKRRAAAGTVANK